MIRWLIERSKTYRDLLARCEKLEHEAQNLSNRLVLSQDTVLDLHERLKTALESENKAKTEAIDSHRRFSDWIATQFGRAPVFGAPPQPSAPVDLKEMASTKPLARDLARKMEEDFWANLPDHEKQMANDFLGIN